MTSLELRGVAEERDEDDAGDRHVVLERVEKEEESAEQREQREREARRERVAEHKTEPADPRKEHQAEDDAGVHLAQKISGPDDLAGAAAVPDTLEGVLDVVGGRRGPSERALRFAPGLRRSRFVEL